MSSWLLLGGGFAAFFLMRTLWLARPGLPITTAIQELKLNSAVLVDVREPSEWTSGVAHQAALLPLSDLAGARQQWEDFLTKHRSKKILLYCHSGSRSGQAAARLRREGYDAINTGSLHAWRQARWPINLPRSSH